MTNSVNTNNLHSYETPEMQEEALLHFKKKLSESSKAITMLMVQRLLDGLKDKLDFKALASRHISVTLEADLNASSQKTQTVYQKLFEATFHFVQQNSQDVLIPAFSMMEKQCGEADISGKFLGSFVYSEAKKLLLEIPESLTYLHIQELS